MIALYYSDLTSRWRLINYINSLIDQERLEDEGGDRAANKAE